MKIDADVRGGGIERGRGNAGDRPKRRQPGYAFRDVGPIGRAVLGVPDLAVIRSCPYQTLLIFGGRNGEDNFPVELAEVVANDSSRGNDVAGILRRQIRTRDCPALTGVRGFEDNLATVIDGVVVEGIDSERRRPMAPVFYGVRR